MTRTDKAGSRNKGQLFFSYASFNSSSAAGHLVTLSVPWVGHSQFYRCPGAGYHAYPGATPGAFETHLKSVFESATEPFVSQWLVRQRLDKLVDAFISMFSQF